MIYLKFLQIFLNQKKRGFNDKSFFADYFLLATNDYFLLATYCRFNFENTSDGHKDDLFEIFANVFKTKKEVV